MRGGNPMISNIILPQIRLDYEEDNFEKLVKNIEKIFRVSKYYNIWVQLQRDKNLKCIISGVTYDDGGDIELHHYPYTLFSIVRRVQIDLINKDQSVSLYVIQHYVQYLHVLDVVPYVPLLKSYHKLWHENPWEINTDQIVNNEFIPIWNEFMQRKMLLDVFIEEVKQVPRQTEFLDVEQ